MSTKHLLRIDQLIFSDLVISEYGLSRSPSPFAAAIALASLDELALLPRERFVPGLGLGTPLLGVCAREVACEEAPLLVNLILVIGFFTAGGGGGLGGAWTIGLSRAVIELTIS